MHQPSEFQCMLPPAASAGDLLGNCGQCQNQDVCVDAIYQLSHHPLCLSWLCYNKQSCCDKALSTHTSLKDRSHSSCCILNICNFVISKLLFIRIIKCIANKEFSRLLGPGSHHLILLYYRGGHICIYSGGFADDPHVQP